MVITLDRRKSNEALIKITLKEGDYQPQVTQKIKEYSKKAQIKGFRLGKVPIGLIKKMYGKTFLVDEINKKLSSSLSEYIKEQDLKILGDPLPNMGKSETIDWDNQEEFEFEYNIGLAGDFKYDLSKKRKVTEYAIKVDQKMVTEELKVIRKNYGERVSVDQSEADDMLQGALVEEAQNIKNEVTFPIQQVEKKERKHFIGKKPGDSITFKLAKAIKDTEYQARLLDRSEEELAEMNVSEVVLNIADILRLEPAKLNQEFFDKLFGKDQVKSEKDLTEKIREHLVSNFQKETDIFLTHTIRKEILKATKMELPDEFLKRWLVVSNEGKVSAEDVAKDYQNYAEEMKWNLILNRIAEDNQINVENDEVISNAKELITAQLASSGLAGQMDDQLDAFADNYLKGNEGQNYLQVFNQVRTEKIMNLIRDKINISKKEVNLDHFKKEAAK